MKTKAAALQRQEKDRLESESLLSKVPAYDDVSQLSPRLTSPRAAYFANMCKPSAPAPKREEPLDDARAELVERSLQIYYEEKAKRKQAAAAGAAETSPRWKQNLSLAGALKR